VPQESEPRFNQRYEIVRPLGEGGMGSVCLVRDSLLSGRPVALKFLKPERLLNGAIDQFKDEFRAMARLRHPNLAEVYDFGTSDADGRHFLTMEFVDGENLERLSRADLRGRFDSLAVQCLRALDYIHARGILHNDIKPQNIMVRPPFQVKLLDFGLASPQAESTQYGLSGTIHYIAPERLQGKAVDGRSDLYSLGVILYEALTGSLPHTGSHAGQVVTSILRGQVRPPRSIDPAIPERHEAFVMALLAPDPASRPAGAAAALELLNQGTVSPLSLDTPETYASFVTSGRFVGRDDELAALLALATAHARSPEPERPPGPVADRPRLVLLSGPAGIGKSRLLRELKHRLQLEGVRNLTGRCYEDGGVPFQPFVEVLRQLPRPSDLPPALRAILDQLAPIEREAGDSAAEASEASERVGKQEFITGVVELLDRLADGSRGVVFLEDLHWSDAPGVDLIDLMLRLPGPGPWLCIGSLRDEEARQAPIGRLLDRHATSATLRRIRLEPLGLEQVTSLIASMVPFADRPEGLSRLLADRTDGNPLYLEELMRSLAEDGTLRRQGGGWIAESRTLESIRLPPSLGSAVIQRVAGLPSDDRDLAETLAVINRPAAADLLRVVTGADFARTVAAMESLERLRLVTFETAADGSRLAGLAHSRIREAVYRQIPVERRRALHAAVGMALETTHAGDLDTVTEELAHHFVAGDDHARAADYCLRAATKADALYNPQREVQFLEQAIEHLPASDAPRRLDALYRMTFAKSNDLHDYEGALKSGRALCDEARKAGDVLHEGRGLREVCWSSGFLGDLAGALDAGRRSLALVRSQNEKKDEVLSLNALGTVCATNGDNLAAREYFEQALTIAVAIGDNKCHIGVLTSMGLNYVGMGEGEKALRFLEEAYAAASKQGFHYSANRILINLGCARYETGDLDGALSAMEEAYAWSRDHPIVEFLLHCYENLGTFHAQRGHFDRAVRHYGEAAAVYREIDNAPGLSPLLDLLGGIYPELGRFQEAKELHREGLALARKIDSRMQEGFHLASLANDLLREGAIQAAEDSAREALEIGRALNHPRITCRALSVQALAAARRGDRKTITATTRALTRIDVKRLRYHERLQLHLTLGRCALALGKPADAEREARAGLPVVVRAGMRELQWRLNALMGDALAARNLPDDAMRFYNVARELIRTIAAEIEDPMMRKDYENEEARVSLIASASDAPGLPAVQAAVPVSGKGDPVKMLTTIYQITQIINSILDLKELLNKVMDLAIDLVGAERGLIFLYRSETDEMEMVVARNIEHQTIKDATEYSRSILKEAGHGRSILSHDAGTDERFKEFRSVSIYHIRSLLCVPLKQKNRIIGTVYVDSRKPGTIFTEDDLRFLEAFANQAAIAIENARLYESTRQENQYLRQAVQERYGYEKIVGRSPRMRELFAILSRVATSSLPVLIRGGSGTGKELVARAIHHNSPRRDRRFFTENCAALPDTLLESELFGHAKGAFTGADTSRRGLFELADGGTLFLDEVGDMSVPMQSKLLRVLQDGEFRPVGSETPRHVDVRVISATSRDLEAMIEQKNFREDLYFRLKVITVKLPSLRERREDIPLLVDHFLSKIALENKRPKLRVEPELMNLLTRYDWPGNVRELENQMERLALFANGDSLTLQDARNDGEFYGKVSAPAARGSDTAITRDDLLRALTQANGNRDEAARLLGVSRATFFRKLKLLGVGQRRPRLVRPPHSA
jgi:Nif-specific regulatory protein